MLRIRLDQMKAFEDAAWRGFEDEMVQHCGGFAPKLCAVAGEANVRRAVRLGIERGSSHGFTLRGPLRFYIEMLVCFGAEFDSDPQLPWVSEALADTAATAEMERAERLYDRMLRYTGEVLGPAGEYLTAAFENAACSLAGKISGPDPFQGRMSRFLQLVFPQKWQSLTDDSARALIREGAEFSAGCSFSSEESVALLVMLMFLFGHGVARDPLYPWVASTLSDPLVENPEDRAARLREKTRIYCTRAGGYLKEQRAASARA